MLPISIDYEYEKPPWATLGLVAMNVLVLVATWSVSGEDLLPFALCSEGFAPWQLITSAFIHGGVVHLIVNMVFLVVFGRYAEGRLGWWRFLLLYAACAIGAGLIWVLEVSLRSPPESFLFMARGPEYLVGASGAISGLMGFTVIAAPRALVRVFWFAPSSDYWAHNRTGDDWPGFPAWFLIGGWVVFQVVLALAGAGTGIAASAHLGGFAAGIGIAVLLHARLLEGTPWHLERAPAGGNQEDAALERTARKWRKIGAKRRERERQEAQSPVRAPPAPSETEATVALPPREVETGEAGEDPYARPPRGSTSPRRETGVNPFEVED